MGKTLIMFSLLWINAALITGCASSKEKVFGDNMPTMKTIHHHKFNKADDVPLERPDRTLTNTSPEEESRYRWLPNPTLEMYVFEHLTPAGHPVPGYTTYFKFFTRDHIAEPGEQGSWE